MIIFTLAYVICPYDIVTDFIPFIGMIDDTMLSLITYQIIKTKNEELLPSQLENK